MDSQDDQRQRFLRRSEIEPVSPWSLSSRGRTASLKPEDLPCSESRSPRDTAWVWQSSDDVIRIGPDGSGSGDLRETPLISPGRRLVRKKSIRTILKACASLFDVSPGGSLPKEVIQHGFVKTSPRNSQDGSSSTLGSKEAGSSSGGSKFSFGKSIRDSKRSNRSNSSGTISSSNSSLSFDAASDASFSDIGEEEHPLPSSPVLQMPDLATDFHSAPPAVIASNAALLSKVEALTRSLRITSTSTEEKKADDAEDEMDKVRRVDDLVCQLEDLATHLRSASLVSSLFEDSPRTSIYNHNARLNRQGSFTSDDGYESEASTYLDFLLSEGDLVKIIDRSRLSIANASQPNDFGRVVPLTEGSDLTSTAAVKSEGDIGVQTQNDDDDGCTDPTVLSESSAPADRRDLTVLDNDNRSRDRGNAPRERSVHFHASTCGGSESESESESLQLPAPSHDDGAVSVAPDPFRTDGAARPHTPPPSTGHAERDVAKCGNPATSHEEISVVVDDPETKRVSDGGGFNRNWKSCKADGAGSAVRDPQMGELVRMRSKELGDKVIGEIMRKQDHSFVSSESSPSIQPESPPVHDLETLIDDGESDDDNDDNNSDRSYYEDGSEESEEASRLESEPSASYTSPRVVGSSAWEEDADPSSSSSREGWSSMAVSEVARGSGDLEGVGSGSSLEGRGEQGAEEKRGELGLSASDVPRSGESGEMIPYGNAAFRRIWRRKSRFGREASLATASTAPIRHTIGEN